MAVKSLSLKLAKAGGIDQDLKAPIGTAEDIFNFRVDPSRGWLCDRGIEPWIAPGSSFTVAEVIPGLIDTLLGAKVDSLFIWTKQSTGQTYILAEQGGYLFYIWGNKGSSVASDWRRNYIILDANRHIPRQNEVGTQYIPYGNRLLIINGVDKPIWFYGDTRLRDFSFLLPTPTPDILDIEPDYLGGSNLLSGTAFPNFTTAPLGLGDRASGDSSFYAYRISFITDSGSESPLSAPIYVNWTIPDDAAAEKRFGIFFNELPIGPKGTVARRIYRTKNQRLGDSQNAVDGVFYFVKQLNDNSSTEFIDIISDTSLTAPVDTTASTVIDTAYKYGATWNGRLWLGGGLTHPTKIIYSLSGLPEQFSISGYFDVGNEKGGAITALYSYYNNLLVFREASIEVIRFNNGAFSISQVSPSVGTRASNSIQLIPSIGVVFLTNDGFYAITGGLDGGSAISVTKISSPISKEVGLISTASIAKAVSVYSEKEKEYWCHYPTKGTVTPSRGAVIHTLDTSWSLRHADSPEDSYLFNFTAMAADPEGNIILGTAPTWRLPNGNSSTPSTNTAIGHLVGLQVWSGASYWGYALTAAVGQGITYTSAKVDLPLNIYESGWIDFGNNSIKHRVFSVDVEIMSYGDYAIDLDWGQDYNSTWNSAPSQQPAKSEILFTTAEDPVFGPANPALTKVPFTVGTSALKEGRLIRIRWDVQTSLVDNFRFRLKSDKPLHLLSYNLIYDSADQLPLNQRARGTSGQPW